MSNGILQDKNGNTSSKRAAGMALVGTGAVYLLAVGVVSIFKVVADPVTALSVGRSLIITGSSLLGIGVLENNPLLQGVKK